MSVKQAGASGAALYTGTWAWMAARIARWSRGPSAGRW